MSTRLYVCFNYSFRGDWAPCISHETIDGVKTLCGRSVAQAATLEPDSNDLDPDCNVCRRVARKRRDLRCAECSHTLSTEEATKPARSGLGKICDRCAVGREQS